MSACRLGRGRLTPPAQRGSGLWQRLAELPAAVPAYRCRRRVRRTQDRPELDRATLERIARGLRLVLAPDQPAHWTNHPMP